MKSIGNFFFRFRNLVFPLAVVMVFIPSRSLFASARTALTLGVLVIALGQLLRVLTIGLFYIKRGGHERRVYAEDLVTEGLFSHCRNPLYVGNLLMIVGFGMAVNSLLCFVAGSTLFVFIYVCIVYAEEDFLRKKFGTAYDAYCMDVPRWRVKVSGLTETLRASEFHWRRVLLKEYGTMGNWMVGLPLALILRNHLPLELPLVWQAADPLLLACGAVGFGLWAGIRGLKKSRILVEA